MAFPSASGTQAETLESAWAGARATASKVKQIAQQIRAASVAGPVAAQQLLDFLAQLATQQERLAACAAVTGIGSYAQQQFPSLNLSAEFSSMQTAITNVRTWMVNNFPKDGSGYLLARQFDGTGRTTDRTFSTAALADFRTQLDGLIATID
jgi:hypothetical protein